MTDAALLLIWAFGNKFQWDLIQNITLFIKENCVENVYRPADIFKRNISVLCRIHQLHVNSLFRLTAKKTSRFRINVTCTNVEKLSMPRRHHQAFFSRKKNRIGLLYNHQSLLLGVLKMISHLWFGNGLVQNRRQQHEKGMDDRKNTK